MITKSMETRISGGKPTYILIFCMILLHVPIAFAGTRSDIQKAQTNFTNKSKIDGTDLALEANNRPVVDAVQVDYESLHLNELGLSKTAFGYAMKGLNYLMHTGKLAKANIISIIDFSKPSSQKRLFVIDINNLRVLYNTYVAHGVNSGKEYANQFSNIPESNKSSLGFYETKNTYSGGNGYSLRLAGLEKGINDNAERRDIVIHGAEYVDESLIRSQGYIGRSWGCPALPEKLHKPIIDKIKNGTCLFIFSPDYVYLKKSKIINA